MEPLNVQQLLAWQPLTVDPIISDGILLPQTRLILYGQWETWKSMSIINMDFKLGTGEKWFHFKTRKSRILTLQLEIPMAEYQKRVIKYVGNDVHYRTADIWFWTEYFLKLDKDYGRAVLERVLTIIKPDILIIDPLYKVISGNISDSTDMNKFLDNMDMVMAKHQCSLIIVHHTRKPVITEAGVISRGIEEMMGTSYLPDWTDTAIGIAKVEEVKDTIDMFFTKLRLGERTLAPIRVKVDRSTLRFHMV